MKVSIKRPDAALRGIETAVRRFAILFLVMFGLSAVFVLLIMTARAMGSAQPPPEAIQALHLTDCQLPCWLGITPGKTTFDEVVQRVNASHPVTTNIRPSENTLDGWYQVGSASVPAIITWDMSGIVVQITLITSDVQNFVAGDVVIILLMKSTFTDYIFHHNN